MYDLTNVRVLILDLDPPSGLGGDLLDILETFGKPKVHFPLNLPKISSLSGLTRKLKGFCSHSDSELVFLTLPPDPDAVLRSLAIVKKESAILPPIIAIIKKENPIHYMDLMKAGITDFLIPPLQSADLLPRIRSLLGKRNVQEEHIFSLKEKFGLKQMIGNAPAFTLEIEKIPIVAKSNTTILINGETGTGKDLFARAIHYLGLRAGHPFIPVNCGAIPADLVENELFGHRKGAFTGADISCKGLISQADGGTIYLNEVDCLPLCAQAKFLCFLQEKVYRPLGSTQMIPADVRIIASTNIDLDLAVKEGRFRRDLYHRLNIIPLLLPPLRERKSDISILARHFLGKFAPSSNNKPRDLMPSALIKLMSYDWPGNVRELENVIERAVVFSKELEITPADIIIPEITDWEKIEPFQIAKAKTVEKFEKDYLLTILNVYRGNISMAANASGKNRRAFFELVRKHNIDIKEIKFSKAPNLPVLQ